MHRLRIAVAATAIALLAGCQDTSDDTKAKSSTAGTDSALKAEAKTAKSEARTARSEAKSASSEATGATTVASTTASAASAGKVDYQEVRVGNNVYVVGSAEAAEQAKAGKLAKPVRAIGFGAPGEKWYFEEKNQAALEAEYDRRHGAR